MKINGVGFGVIIKLVRSGLVILKIEEVIKWVELELFENCFSCGVYFIWEGDYLICLNKLDCFV